MKGAWGPKILACVITAGLFVPPPALSDEQQLKEAELARLRSRIEVLRSELNQVRNRYDGLRSELRKTEQAIGRVTKSLRDLDRRLKLGNARLAALEQRQQALETSVQRQRGHLGAQIRSAYAIGRQEYMKILLNQDDPAALGRVLTYYDYLNRARSERISSLQADLTELESVRRELSAETERLAGLRQQRQVEKSLLDESRRDRGRLLARLQEEIDTKDKRLDRLVLDEKELADLVRALTEAMADIPDNLGQRVPFEKLHGKLSWPTRGSITARFGSERAQGRMRWQGVLIGANEGEEVRAVSHGRVAFAEWLRGYGLLMIIDHGDGYMSLYGHNQTLFKETGDWVEAGEPVARVGNSGGQERSALYFEIRHNGRPADPARWCQRRG